MLQIYQFFPLAFGAKKEKITEDSIFAHPNTGLAVAIGAQQPLSFLVHSAHLPIHGGRDQCDLPGFAALFYDSLHILYGYPIDLR